MSHSKPAATAPPDYSWADHLIYLEAGAEIPWPTPKPASYPRWYGVALAAAMTAVAYAVTAIPGLPAGLVEPVTVVLPLGILTGNLVRLPEAVRPGVRYTVKTVLTVGIVLLGVRLNLGDVFRVGGAAIVASVVQVGLMLALAMGIGRLFGLARRQSTLLGIGTAICGGSAVLAAAPVIEAEERDVAFAVATVSFLGLAAMFLLPLVGHQLGMTPQAFGVWIGLAIHQTPQVVAAGFAYHPDAGQAATLVKLARVSLLAPLVLALGFVYRRRTAVRGKKMRAVDFVPPVVAGFLAMVLLHSAGLLPVIDLRFARWPGFSMDLQTMARTASAFLIAMGMAAVGLETSLGDLRKVGWRPIVAGLVLAVAAVLFGYAAVRLVY